jgi:hypothetical protein
MYNFAAFSNTVEAACSYAEEELIKAHYDMDIEEKAYNEVCTDFYSDCFPLINLRHPAVYQLLGAKNWITGSNGAVQHPEIETMRVEDYDDLSLLRSKRSWKSFCSESVRLLTRIRLPTH